MGYAINDPNLRLMNTDMYQATMSQAWFETLANWQEILKNGGAIEAGATAPKKGIHDENSSYYLHWRTPPLGSKYTCVAGLEEAIDFLDNFGFDEGEIEYLRDLYDGEHRVFSDEFLDYLANMKLELDIDAVPEGEVMLTEGPVIRLKGPRVQAQLVESLLLQIMNSNSIIATRASLLNTATDNQPIINMSLRRAANGGLGVSRSAHIGGCLTTASMHHARMLGIKPAGTMAHAFIMSFQVDGIPNVLTERFAFETYMRNFPGRTTMLIDTYDPEQGVRNAIQAAINTNIPLMAVRLDSGDIYGDAIRFKAIIDEAAVERPDLFANTTIVATDGLEESKIKGHKARAVAETGKEFPVKIWGVGTTLGNPGPFNGGVYKICAKQTSKENDEWQGCMKIAGFRTEEGKEHLPSSKASIPGADLDVLRLWKDGKIVAEIITDNKLSKEELLKGGFGISLGDHESKIPLPPFDDVTNLLVPVYRKGQKVFEEPAQKKLKDGRTVTDLDARRSFHLKQKAAISEDVVKLIDPRIQEERIEIIAKTRNEQSPCHEADGLGQKALKVQARA